MIPEISFTVTFLFFDIPSNVYKVLVENECNG